ncbi:hypothetical protein B0H13DRAFT_1899136 [Mycena leptocephala]|nr:hypothetical protein B0H13DRAFT_1899136 [Mycena leptocephala]
MGQDVAKARGSRTAISPINSPAVPAQIVRSGLKNSPKFAKKIGWYHDNKNSKNMIEKSYEEYRTIDVGTRALAPGPPLDAKVRALLALLHRRVGAGACGGRVGAGACAGLAFHPSVRALLALLRGGGVGVHMIVVRGLFGADAPSKSSPLGRFCALWTVFVLAANTDVALPVCPFVPLLACPMATLRVAGNISAVSTVFAVWGLDVNTAWGWSTGGFRTLNLDVAVSSDLPNQWLCFLAFRDVRDESSVDGGGGGGGGGGLWNYMGDQPKIILYVPTALLCIKAGDEQMKSRALPDARQMANTLINEIPKIHVLTAVFSYDYLLTLSAEVMYIWVRGNELGSAWFLLIRYSAILGNIAEAFLLFGSFSPESQQTHAGFLDLGLFVASWDSCGTAVVWEALYEQLCLPSVDSKALLRLGLDLIILGLTLYRGFQQLRGPTLSGSLWQVLIRDGAMYFGIITLANLANILIQYIRTSGSLSWFSAMLSAVMISRLMLNLHSAADPNTELDGSSTAQTRSIHFARVHIPGESSSFA